MLLTDGVGIFASFTIAQYYRTARKDTAIFLLYVFFWVLCVVFVVLSISDTLVIMHMNQTWATLPIIRGLAFRGPLTLVELWMIHRQHAK
jgi:hypothetical protein